MDLLTEIIARTVPADAAPHPGTTALVTVVVLSAVAVAWWPAWRVLRLLVTLVHELGHALVGVAVGRRFTGFVLRADMSGHAVTVGPATGLGVVVMTAAGYPAPALVGSTLVWLAARGWSAPVLGALVAGLVIALPFVRSLLTAVVVMGTAAATGALWWWRDDVLQQHVVIALGLVLLVGAWRHLATVLGRVSAGSDPGALARLTGLPVVVWQAVFVIALGAASWAAVSQVLPVLR